MRQKWLVVPTQAFSTDIKGKSQIDFESLPWIVRLYVRFFNKKVFVILDECSLIKTNAPMPEHKKSSRSRTIKLLNEHSEARLAMTGTLMTKSPVNVIDPYTFLSARFFAGESVYDFAENYCIMMTLPTQRGRRVMISQKVWDSTRKYLIHAYNLGGEQYVNVAKDTIYKRHGITPASSELILTRKKYSPFKNVGQLMKRLESVTMTVTREDIFDIKHDRFVYEPINRSVEIGEKGKRLGNELVKVGFTDQIVLGKAKALELLIRLQDICNGFEPIEIGEGHDEWAGFRQVVYTPLKENPKLDALRDLLAEINLEEDQVVIWCARRNAFDSISSMLEKEEVPFAMYSGAQSTEEKKEAEDKASTGEARVFLANPASAGYGLNCLKRFNYCVWYCVNASVEQYHQAQHRILRGESKSPKFAYQIGIKGSIEEKIHRTLGAGQDLLTDSNTREIFEFE